MADVATLQNSDSLSAFAQEAGASYDGARAVAERDMPMPQYKRPPSQEAAKAEYISWNNERGDHGRPTQFQPNGSFAALRLAGKLADNVNSQGIEARTIQKEKKYFVPGYTGFVRGSQHISGRTFGEMTRRAFDTDYREHVCTSPIPSGPQANRKIQHIMPENSFMSNIGKNNGAKHVPGYTGHVPGVRATFSKSYGAASAQEMASFLVDHPRDNPQEAENMASTCRPRQMLHIDSAPLPGTQVSRPPDKLIPAHLKYLRFFPL